MMQVISPHLDDAVLSLGQFMQTEECVVHTMFSRIPKPGVLTDYDASRGYTASAKAMHDRKIEDHKALALLGATPRHNGFFDSQYGGLNDADIGLLLGALDAIMSPEIHTFAPLGIGHPDHRMLSHYARRAVPSGELLLYEELPYRVLWPEQVFEALAQVRASGWNVEMWPLPQGDREVKAQAIACYASQFPNGADDPCLLVPERVWRCTR